MANVVKLKRSAVSGNVPSTSQLELGEVALNTFDGDLFFKKDNGTESIVSVVTTNGTQTLTNKTLDDVSLTGTVTFDGSAGSTGQVLVSAGEGGAPVWGDFALDNLTDVSVSGATTQQVLKFNGTSWVAGDVDVAVASAIFAPQAQSDLGFVNEASSSLTDEDLGLVTETTVFIYDMGRFTLDGIVSLSNIDQSVKADYIGYAIIFGF